MKRATQFTAIAMTGMLGLGMIAPVAANASRADRDNTALALGAVSAALLLTQRDKVPGIVVGAGAILAATQIGHRDDRGPVYPVVYRDRDGWDRGHTDFRGHDVDRGHDRR